MFHVFVVLLIFVFLTLSKHWITLNCWMILNGFLFLCFKWMPGSLMDCLFLLQPKAVSRHRLSGKDLWLGWSQRSSWQVPWPEIIMRQSAGWTKNHEEKHEVKSWAECFQKHLNNMNNSHELKCELHGIIELLHQAILVLVHEFCLEAQQCWTDAKRLCRWCQMIPVYTQCTVQNFSKTRYSDCYFFRIFFVQKLLDVLYMFLRCSCKQI